MISFLKTFEENVINNLNTLSSLKNMLVFIFKTFCQTIFQYLNTFSVENLFKIKLFQSIDYNV